MIDIRRTDKGMIRIEVREENGESAVDYLDSYDAKELVKEILDAMVKQRD
ncbi:MAG: hypothetical protein WCS15_06340 [Prevotella sp.]